MTSVAGTRPSAFPLPPSAFRLLLAVLVFVVFGRSGLAEDTHGEYGGPPPAVSPWPRMPSSSGERDSYGVVPNPPSRPIPVSRPNSWPGGPGDRTDASQSQNASPTSNLQPPTSLEEPVPCEGAAILARVGSYAILASEVMPAVNALIEHNKSRIHPSQLDAQREALVKRHLRQLIDNKLIYCDARRGIPEEGYENVKEQIAKQFETVELKTMMERAEVTTRQELRRKLRQAGTSLEREKRAFTERTLGKQWLQHQINFDEEITHQQRLAYYREHLADFEKPASVRWEHLMIKFSRCPDKTEAYRTLAEMGNRVIDGGAGTFAKVAKARSHGSTASSGGLRDWTTKGSLVSDVLDRAIFSVPVGKLSPILEDERGLHIIRVIERREAGRTPFVEAQVGIREKIRKERVRAQLKTYLAKLKKDVPVWTVFDGQPEQQLSSRPRQSPR